MCGICGVRRFGPEPITSEQISILLMGNERRGNQATGIALQQMDGGIQVYKDDEPASRAVMDPKFREFLDENLREDTLCMIGHTRAATKGLTMYPKNNHPMWDDTTAVVHNGVLYNDDQLFASLHLERVADTDSDIFRAILSKDGLTTKGVNSLNKVSGSAAIAALSTDYPGKLLLARSGNPIVLATTENHLIWSSEKQPIYDALRPYFKRFGIWQRMMKVNAGFTNMANDTAWLIGAEPRLEGDGDYNWVEWHAAFKVSYSFNSPRYAIHDTYNGARTRMYNSKKAIMVICRNKKCRAYMQLTPDQREKMDSLKCMSCGWSLKEKK